MELYGQIDLTILGEIVRNHPDCIKSVSQKDGKIHKYININISERQTPSQYGHTHYVKAGIPKAQQRPDTRYFVADLKTSNNQQSVQAQPVVASQEPQQSVGQEPELPF